MYQVITYHRISNESRIVKVSTIRLPQLLIDKLKLESKYETCAFLPGGENEVLEKYEKEGSALMGHFRNASKFGPAMKWYQILWYNLTH